MWGLSERLSVTIHDGCVELRGIHRFVLTPNQWKIIPLQKVADKLYRREAKLYRLPFNIDVQCLPRVVYIDHSTKWWEVDADEKYRVHLSPAEWFELVKLAPRINQALCQLGI